jgi:hypothetical protein
MKDAMFISDQPIMSSLPRKVFQPISTFHLMTMFQWKHPLYSHLCNNGEGGNEIFSIVMLVSWQSSCQYTRWRYFIEDIGGSSLDGLLNVRA